jgi:hypothetical protein
MTERAGLPRLGLALTRTERELSAPTMCSSRKGVTVLNARARQPPGQQAAATIVLRWELDRERTDPDRHPGSGVLGTATVPLLCGCTDSRATQSTEKGDGCALGEGVGHVDA